MFKARKSCRIYNDQVVLKEDIEKIIEAGQYAPSGGNSKCGKFVVLQNPDILSTLDVMVQTEFSKMTYDENMYVSMKHSIAASKQGMYHFAYNCNALILFYNKKSYPNNMADCVCALENMTLKATELKIGSCYINQIHWLTDNEAIRTFLKDYQLEEDEDVYCALSLGYPKDEEFFEKSRIIKENEVYFY